MKEQWDKLKLTIEENSLYYRNLANDKGQLINIRADSIADVYEFLLGLMNRMEQDKKRF